MNASNSKVAPEILEARWRGLLEGLPDHREDPDYLVRIGNLALEMDRRSEAWLYLSKAARLDRSKSFLLPQLRKLAEGPDQLKVLAELEKKPKPFVQLAGEAFAYPFSGPGAMVLLMGAVFFAVMRIGFAFAAMLPLGGVLVLMGMAFLLAYVCEYYFDVLRKSAHGEDDLPNWPEVGSDLLADLLKFVGAAVASFLPLVVFLVSGFLLLPAFDPAGLLVLGGGGVLTILGFFYLPMAIMINGFFGSAFACFNPVFALRSILAAPGNYAICVLVTGSVYGLVGLIEGAIVATGIPFVGEALSSTVGLYGMTVIMRVLGSFVFANRPRMEWLTD